MKNTILDIIYDAYESWSTSEVYSCRTGCATCCTTNVTITTTEGKRILAFCLKEKTPSWLMERLSSATPGHAPIQTTNEYIATVLQGRPSSPPTVEPTGRCPFLENNRCSIYRARPFSCRCFISTIPCHREGAATVPDHHLYGSMAVMQIIEHLCQFEHWGTMHDVLLSLAVSPPYNRRLSTSVGKEQTKQTGRHLLTARPLPGFVIPETEEAKIAPLLHAIFTKKIGDKTIEQILNGR